MNCVRKITNLRFTAWTALVLVSVGTIPAVGDDSSSAPAGLSMAEAIRQFQADARSIEGAFLPDSPAGFAAMERLQAAWLKRLESIDFAGLDRAGKLDYLLLHNEIGRSADNLAQQRRRLANIDELVGFRAAIIELEQARRQGEAIDCRAAAEKLCLVAEKVKRLRERIEKGKRHASKSRDKGTGDGNDRSDKTPLVVSPGTALHAAEAVTTLRRTLGEWYEEYNGFLPEFDWWVKQPYEDTRKQLEAYAKILREEIAGQKGKADGKAVVDYGIHPAVSDARPDVFEEVEKGLIGFDFEREERAFTPHITLGRMRTPAPFPNGDVPALEGMEFPVDALVLFKSTLTPAGALYTPIWKIKLGGEDDEGRSKQDKGS